MGTRNFSYDAEGARIGKGTLASAPGSYTATCAPPFGSGFTLTNRYLVDLGGDQVTELNGSGVWQHSNVWAGGKLVATYDTKGIHFELTDPLGTKRVQANAQGQVDETCTSLPFGNEVGNSPGANCAQPGNQLGTGDDATEHHFTGKERDTESGNDYFGARYYASSMGRFMSPDWSAKVEPVPYSKLDNPQTLNLYAYVGNNPLSRTDPTGHADIAAQCKGQSSPCNVTLTQTVNIVHQHTDKKTGETSTVIDSTLKVTTNFSVTTDAKGNMSASASSTVANVSGYKYSDSQLATMGTNIGTMQQAAVGMGFGANTTQLVTGIGAAETRFGTAPNGTSHDYMNPAINPMQLTGGNGANLNLNHNVEGAMGVLDWAGSPSGFDPTPTYYRYSDRSDPTMANWQGTYSSITEQQP